MPQNFIDCKNAGGKIVTKNLKGNKYIRICYDKKGNAHPSYVEKRKEKSDNNKPKLLVEDLRKLQKYFNDNYHST